MTHRPLKRTAEGSLTAIMIVHCDDPIRGRSNIDIGRNYSCPVVSK